MKRVRQQSPGSPGMSTGTLESHVAAQTADLVMKEYLRRVGIYLLGTVGGGMLGSALSWTSDTWANANPLTGGVSSALFSLGPAILILGIVDLRRGLVTLLSAGAAAAMVTMWLLFVTSESSTSAFIFIWGWIVGIPLAAVVATLAIRTPSRFT